MRLLIVVAIFFLNIALTGCSRSFLKDDEPQGLSIDEGLPEVKVKEIGDDPNVSKLDLGALPIPVGTLPMPELEKVEPTPLPTPTISFSGKKKSKKTTGVDLKKRGTQDPQQESKVALNSSSNVTEKKKELSQYREPHNESSLGFTGNSRRPDRIPFRVGEKVVMSVRYFKAQAGELSLEVKPHVEVNGRKSYRWHTGLRTTGMFSNIYTIDDWSETLVDFETLAPSVFTLHVRESGQMRNGKGYFDPVTLKGVYIEKKYSEKKGRQEKRQQWQVLPYAQNVFSAAFYMRVFTYEIGKPFHFTVADDEKNIVFKGSPLRKEHVETEAGEFDTIVIKPEFEIDGVFKPVGDIFFWMTDDDRKLIVRIESEIKIGTLVMEATQVDRGND
jgi:hypothetical protein